MLLLGVNHTWELGLRAPMHPSTLPLQTHNTVWLSQNEPSGTKHQAADSLLLAYLLQLLLRSNFHTSQT